LDDRWGVAVEPSGTRRGGTQSTAQLLGAVSYNVSPALVLDSGFAFSTKNGGKDHSFFAGLTWLALRLF
ncbi:MAG TPA: hypothetical protein VMU47_24215, partial [Caldimonas sp.]|nr:hypothetical protein [Caldimonas sp.]